MANEPPIAPLADATVPLETSTFGETGSGLAAVADALDDAAVVGLGEATHGTREFSELKACLVRHLVEERGLRLLAIEAAFADAVAVDEYVRGEYDGPASAAIAEMGFWTWSTEALRDLVEWLRAFNEGRPRDDRVRVFGVDVQDVGGSADALLDYLAATAPADEDLTDDLHALEDGVPYGREGAEDAVSTLETVAPAVAAHLDDNRGACVGATSEREFGVARRHATVLERGAEFWRHMLDGEALVPVPATETRDDAMAENVAWLLEHTRHTQVAVWAHNGHVKRGGTDWFDGDAPTMGEFLGREFGDGYYALGFDFHHGSFHARDSDTEGRPLREFTVDCRHEDALAATLADAGCECAFLETATARDAGLADDHPVRSIGGGYAASDGDEFWERYDLSRDLDGVVFVAETTSSRLLDVEPVRNARKD